MKGRFEGIIQKVNEPKYSEKYGVWSISLKENGKRTSVWRKDQSAVPQRVLFPLHSGLKRNSPVGEITRAGCSSWIPASRRLLGKWACRCTCTNLASTKWPTKYSPSVTKNPFAWTSKSDRLPGQALGLAPPSWSFGGFCKSSNPSTSKASIKSSDPRPPFLNAKLGVQKVVTLCCNPMPKFVHIQANLSIIVEE